MPRADDAERHGPERDVDDDPRLGAALGEAAVGDEARRAMMPARMHSAYMWMRELRPEQVDLPELPFESGLGMLSGAITRAAAWSLVRLAAVRPQSAYFTRARAARELPRRARAARRRRRRARARTSAEPTIAPSAYSSTPATCSAVEMPMPTQARAARRRRARRATSVRAAASTSARAPVMPIVETA